MSNSTRKIYDHLITYGPLTIDTVAYDLDMHDMTAFHVMFRMYERGLIRGSCTEGYTVSYGDDDD